MSWKIKGNWILDGGISINQLTSSLTRLSIVPAIPNKRTYSNQWAPRLALLKKMNGHVSLYASLARGFSPPTTSELLPSSGIVSTDLNAESGEAAARSLGPRARFAVADVTNAAQVQAAVDTAVKSFGALHGLINCAGIAPAERVVGRDGPHALESFSRVININLVGSFNALRLAAAAMTGNTPNADGERGVIINTASVAAFEGQLGQAA